MVLQIKPEEISATMNDFAEPGTLAPTGLHLGGTTLHSSSGVYDVYFLKTLTVLSILM